MFNYCLKLSSCVLTFFSKFPYTREQRVFLGEVDTKVGGYPHVYMTGSLTSNIAASSGIWFWRVWALWAWLCKCNSGVIQPQLNDIQPSGVYPPNLFYENRSSIQSIVSCAGICVYISPIFLRHSTLALKQHHVLVALTW